MPPTPRLLRTGLSNFGLIVTRYWCLESDERLQTKKVQSRASGGPDPSGRGEWEVSPQIQISYEMSGGDREGCAAT